MKRVADYVPDPGTVLDKAGLARWLKIHPRSVQRLMHREGFLRADGALLTAWLKAQTEKAVEVES